MIGQMGLSTRILGDVAALEFRGPHTFAYSNLSGNDSGGLTFGARSVVLCDDDGIPLSVVFMAGMGV